ncbi:MAG: hypothetical protein E6G66_04320 [Actinobacteria bacterium]|nr:MAG: hypothetical protein E6G66_04320 [Actinomycetota bacterium]
MVGTEANPAGSPSPHPGACWVGVAPSAKGAETPGGIQVGAWVQVVGRRGRFRVIGVTAHGVELRDRDERWHAVRPEKVRVAGHDSAQAGPQATRQPRAKIPGPRIA